MGLFPTVVSPVAPESSPVTEPVLREPEQIRQDCAAKLRPIETSGMFSAILGCLLGEDWATPRIEQLIVTDKCLLARTEGEVTHKLFLGGLIPKRATCWTRESRKTGEFRGPAVEWSVAALHLALKAGVGTEVPFT